MYNISFFSSYFLQFIRFIFINEFQFLIQKKSNNKNISFFICKTTQTLTSTDRPFVCLSVDGGGSDDNHILTQQQKNE